MHHVKIVHVLQPIRSIDQLNQLATSVFTRYDTIAHELDTIDPFILLHELDDITVIHPFRHHREPVPFQIHTDERQDIRVS